MLCKHSPERICEEVENGHFNNYINYLKVRAELERCSIESNVFFLYFLFLRWKFFLLSISSNMLHSYQFFTYNLAMLCRKVQEY